MGKELRVRTASGAVMAFPNHEDEVIRENGILQVKMEGGDIFTFNDIGWLEAWFEEAEDE